MKIISKIFFLVLLICINNLSAQNTTKTKVIVDKKGVMRWENSNDEVKGFGVNYTVPFAHAYRSAKKMGIDPKNAIDNDVYHFSRLGFDLFRIHVWDTQISDTLGNLIQNEHLDALDYLLKKLKEKNINFVITPIAFWGNGWPEPDTYSPGFSHKYGKDACLTNPEAIKAQENYLAQFLNHVNPYTKIAYKSEPNIIAFEVSNEPHHRGKPEEVTEFIKGMVAAMRSTGTEKPIFYNITHAVQLNEAYFEAEIQGGTFQWYPTGLGYQRELSGNLLPNVSNYNIPFDNIIKEHQGAKLVYEFDAADVGKSYIYPAMARSFRTAGIQIATHFSYDPTFLAYANTEYNTHYMNLAYTPQKALSLMICNEVFHEIPMNQDFGTFPENNSFGDFKINYLNDLAEYNSEEKFFYTNNTISKPKNERKLEQIAGFGNSEIVKYQGLGAYFLDKIEEGIWRLEVMPDAVGVSNPFGRNSLHKTVGVIKWDTWEMAINLKELGPNFKVEAIDKGNLLSTIVEDHTFNIGPGTYIISKTGSSKNWQPSQPWKTGKLNDFVATKTTVDKAYFNHVPMNEISERQSTKISAQIIAPKSPNSVELWVFKGYQRAVIKMERKGYNYTSIIPENMIETGYLKYYIVAKFEDKAITYPAGLEGEPFDWDFYDRNPFEVRVVPKSFPIYLFNAKTDADLLVKQWRNTLKLVPTKQENETAYQINIEKLFVPDAENTNATPIYDYSFKQFIIDKIKGRKSDLSSKENIVFYGNALNNKPCKLQIALVMNDGNSYGTVVEIGTQVKDYKVNLKSLKSVKTVTLPRPYPSFLPYYLDHNVMTSFDITKVESIQFSIGPDITKKELADKHGISIISVRLE